MALTKQKTNLANGLSVKLGVMVIGAATKVFGIGTGPMPFPSAATVFANHVFKVFFVRACKQMFWINAALVGWIFSLVKLIAAMTGSQPVRQWTINQFVGETVRFNLFLIKPECTVTVSKKGGSPKPAAVRRGLINFCKESINGGFMYYDWFSHSVRISLHDITNGLIRPVQGLTTLCGPSYFTAR